MSTNRMGRINEELQRELSALLRTVKDPRAQGTMITVTRVETSGDLRYARVYVSALDKSKEKDVLKALRSAAGYLRRELGAAVQLRVTPELQFVADDSIEKGTRILKMLRDPGVVKPVNPMNDAVLPEDGR